MVQLILLVLLMIGFAEPSFATVRYVDATAGACAGNYSIASRNCTGSDGTSYATFTAGIAATVAGDTLYLRVGTYTTALVLGSKEGAAGSQIVVAGYPNELVTIQPVGANDFIQYTAPLSYITFSHLTFDGVNQSLTYGIKFNQGTSAYYGQHHITFDDMVIDHAHASGILINGDGFIVRNTIIRDGQSDCVAGHRYYGIYVSQGTNTLIENVEIDNMPGGGIQVYPGSPIANTGVVVRKSNIHDNDWCGNSGVGGMIISGNSHGTQVLDSLFVNNGSPSPGTRGSGILVASGVDNTLIRNNTTTGNSFYGIRVNSSGSTGTIIENNIVVGNTETGISNLGTGTTLTTNITTGVIADYTVSSSDFTLKSGSTAIDTGTVRSGFNYDGSTQDIGAFESVPNPTCSITASVITCIFPMSVNVPILNLSTTGVTIGCTGSACPGSPTANSVSRVVGTDTHVAIAITGISGNACVAANQTWTLTYNSGTGTWTDNANIGIAPGIHQKIFSFTGLAVTNNCTGAAASGYPAGYHIFYQFEDGSGTNVNDSSANNLDGTFTNTPTWGAGKTGGGMVISAGSTQYTAVPWGSGVNPYSTDLTIVAPVNIAVGAESTSHYVFSPTTHGTNQRLYVCSQGGTWRISYQSVSCPNTSASNLTVTSGWNHLVLLTNSTTHVATLYKDGIVGTGGASVTLSSYTLAANLALGKLTTLSSTGGTYDDFLVYLSLQDPVAIYNAFQAVATPGAGTLVQAAVQAQGVYFDSSGAVTNFGALNSAVETVVNGAISLVFQVHCQVGADCDETAFKLTYAKNQTAATAASAGTLLQVPNMETSDGTWMWGTNPATGLNNGETTTRLTGSCTVTNGSTQLTADQVPSVDLPDDGCVTLRYILRFSAPVETFFEFRLLTQAGLALDGGYTADAHVTVVNPRASGIGF